MKDILLSVAEQLGAWLFAVLAQLAAFLLIEIIKSHLDD